MNLQFLEALPNNINRYKCHCGKEFSALKYNVAKGSTKSCGCLKKRLIAEKNQTHGLSKEDKRLYIVWKAMRQRCNNPNASNYPRYGGRGISICKEWGNFQTFHRWAKESGYADNLTIERKNNDGDYSPENCRWATKKEQGQNTSTSLGVEAANEIRASKESTASLSKKHGVNRSTIKRVRNKTTY